MPKPACLIGRRFTRWLVIAELPPRRYGKQPHRQFLCRCDCGKEKSVSYANLTAGRSVSCGCIHRDLVKHGHAHDGKLTRTYIAWCSMITRCNSTHINYGGRGIEVCQRWRESFTNFLADMGECPPGLELDRWPDKNGNYEPGNCRWANDMQQSRNRRSNRVLTVRGKTACLSELCEHFGANQRRVWARLHLGWSVEAAFLAPKFTRDPLLHI